MTRLFVAAWPPDDVATRLIEQFAGDEPGVRRVPAGNLHVTLRFLGDVDVADASAALDATVLPRAVAMVGSGARRLGGRQIVVPVAGVDELARAVGHATAGLCRPDRHDFFGHVTVARLSRGATSTIDGAPFRGSFAVDEVRLVESRLESTGAVYSTVHAVDTQ